VVADIFPVVQVSSAELSAVGHGVEASLNVAVRVVEKRTL
jgi:hypothetical protein